MTPKAQLLLCFTAAAALSGTALAQPAWEGGQKFSIVLTAAAEPHGGDVNASGTADITINPGQRRVCWEITTTGINAGYTITGAHIHEAPVGVAGPVVVPLDATRNGTNTNCVTVTSREQIMEILKSPEDFYVNVHWVDLDEPITLPSFGAGGIRGQLDKAPLKSND